MAEQHDHQNLRPEDLPEMQRGRLDESTLASYVRDIKMLADQLHVRLKAADSELAQGPGVPLEQAIDAILTGKAYGAQVRYTYQGSAWADTITVNARGLEITRLALPIGVTPTDTAP